VEAAVVQLSRRRRILALLALAVDAVAMLGPYALFILPSGSALLRAGLGERLGRSASGR
jgi:hypothetical protein